VHVKQIVVSGSNSSLSAFAAEAAVVGSMMFVALLLAAGMLALEREENAFSRLMRGLVPGWGLLGAKVALGALCGVPLALGMLAILSFFLDLDRGRFLVWVPVALLAALAFSALGVAIGAIGRDVRVASLLAFALSLPVAALALVPSGAVAEGVYDVISAISAIFPFKASLGAFDAAVSGGSLGGHLLHLAGLTAAFAALARLALRRLA
jgi:ABC-2 type transport system permease protein